MRLGKVAIDLPAMECSYEFDPILFDGQANPIVANPGSVVGSASTQLLKAGNIG